MCLFYVWFVRLDISLKVYISEYEFWLDDGYVCVITTSNYKQIPYFVALVHWLKPHMFYISLLA